MKQLLLLPFLSMAATKMDQPATNPTPANQPVIENKITEGLLLKTEPLQDKQRMLASVFKNQDFCRAEITDFPFDVQFKVVSATVYFSGANFRNVEMGNITSNSLQPVRNLMNRCVPGSIVVFDDFKVMGPDNKVRTIQPLSIVLY